MQQIERIRTGCIIDRLTVRRPPIMFDPRHLLINGDIYELIQRNALAGRNLLRTESHRGHKPQRELVLNLCRFFSLHTHLFPSVRRFKNAPGVKTLMPNLAPGSCRCFTLCVTITSTRPLIATSRTISSAGSIERGRCRSITSMASENCSSLKINRSVSAIERAEASRCSGLMATSRYSHAVTPSTLRFCRGLLFFSQKSQQKPLSSPKLSNSMQTKQIEFA